jgi:hypothetical protein
MQITTSREGNVYMYVFYSAALDGAAVAPEAAVVFSETGFKHVN